MRRSILLLAVLLGVSACSGDGDDAGPDEASTTVDASDVGGSTSRPAAEPADVTGSTSVDSAGDDIEPASPSTAASVAAVPETGVPGLDSDDAFCAAWSRFGGSWQVLLVGSTFLGDPDRVATWEVAAAPVIESAFAELTGNLPDELASEAEAVSSGYFGALQRRSASALEALRAAGADVDAERQLAAAWLDALATRDPIDADLRFELPEELRPVVASAVADFRARRVDFHLDPSMVVGVETPLTDAYLETACPDQGTLTGQEVPGG